MKNTTDLEYKLIGWKQNGQPIEPPDGIHAEDYFRDGRYIGPDTDGVEPIIQIRYENGIHMTQYFTNEQPDGWLLVGYDGVLRDIDDEGEIADAFAARMLEM